MHAFFFFCGNWAMNRNGGSLQYLLKTSSLLKDYQSPHILLSISIFVAGDFLIKGVSFFAEIYGRWSYCELGRFISL